MTKKYKIIYADPAWTYQDKALAGNRGACCKYPVMSIEELKKIPIAEMADVDCALFLWVTMPKLNEVFELIEVWGFEYKTVAFTWVKKNKSGLGWFMGMGRWTRANAELCLLATKGNPKRVNASVSQIVDSRIMRHSEKPKEVRHKIVKLMGDVPRIELFARDKIDGWDAWGNELTNQRQKLLI